MAKKTYKVIGPFVTHDTEPGGTFTADFTDEDEARLVDQGAVEIVAAKKADAKQAGSSSSGASDTGGGS